MLDCRGVWAWFANLSSLWAFVAHGTLLLPAICTQVAREIASSMA